MHTPELKVGDHVRAIVEGQLSEVYGEHSQFVTIPYGETVITFIRGEGMAQVEFIGEAEWPPQAGDLWKQVDGGTMWFATDVRDDDESDIPEIRLISQLHGQTQWLPENVITCYGRLSLLHREVSSEPGQVEPELSDGTVSISGVAPKSIVVYSGWNDGNPVVIDSVEDLGGVVCVHYKDPKKPRYSRLPATVPSDMQVTPCALNETVSADTLVTPYGGAE
jgi:hypothetical protein